MDNSVWVTILQIIAAPATLIFGALATLAVQLIRIQSDKIIAAKLKLTSDTMDVMNQICKNAVQASEQLYKAKQITDRKAYAVEFARRIRDEKGINFNDVLLDALVESLVWDTFSTPTVTTTTTTTSPSSSTSTSTAPEPIPDPGTGAVG